MPSFRVEVYGDQDLQYLPGEYTNGNYSLHFRRCIFPGATVAALKDTAAFGSSKPDAVYLHVGANDLDNYLDSSHDPGIRIYIYIYIYSNEILYEPCGMFWLLTEIDSFVLCWNLALQNPSSVHDIWKYSCISTLKLICCILYRFSFLGWHGRCSHRLGGDDHQDPASTRSDVCSRCSAYDWRVSIFQIQDCMVLNIKHEMKYMGN